MRYQKVVNEIDSGKNVTEKSRYNYVYSDGQLILLSYTTNGTTQNAKFIYDSAGEVRGFVVNGTTQYLYVKNPQGDIVAIINESGVPVVRYIYDAWGNTTITTDSGYENLVNLSPFAYRGYCYDNDIKMYYLQSRYYDPKICRFINADSSEYLGATGTVLSCNLFAYCENDPVNCVDATGNEKNYIYNFAKDLEPVYGSYSIARNRNGTKYRVILGTGNFKKVAWVKFYYGERKDFYRSMGIDYFTETNYYTLTKQQQKTKRTLLDIGMELYIAWCTKGTHWLLGTSAGIGITQLLSSFLDKMVKKPGDYKIYSIYAKIPNPSTKITGLYDQVVTVQVFKKSKGKWKQQTIYTTIMFNVGE